jgi:hypothetical protein
MAGAGEDRDLAWDEIATRLSASPVWWIATASRSAGPHSVPVWGVVVDGVALSYADPSARRVRDLAEDPRCAVHLESGSDVLIVHGSLEDAGDAAADPVAVAAYARKYAAPGDAQYLPGAPQMAGVRLLALSPVRAMAWRLDDFFGSQRRWSAG